MEKYRNEYNFTDFNCDLKKSAIKIQQKSRQEKVHKKVSKKSPQKTNQNETDNNN